MADRATLQIPLDLYDPVQLRRFLVELLNKIDTVIEPIDTKAASSYSQEQMQEVIDKINQFMVQ